MAFAISTSPTRLHVKLILATVLISLIVFVLTFKSIISLYEKQLQLFVDTTKSHNTRRFGDSLAIVSYMPIEHKFLVEVESFLLPSWRWSLQHANQTTSRQLIDIILFVDPGSIRTLPNETHVIDAQHFIDQYNNTHTKPSNNDIGEWIFNEVCLIRERIHDDDDDDGVRKRSQSYAIVHRREPNDFWTTHKYLFMHSLDFVVEPRYNKLLSSYDDILRTDLDIFVTPNLMSYRPEVFVVGRGSYVHVNFTGENLKKISAKMGLRHQGVHNIGSTWMGDPDTMIELVSLTLVAGKHLLLHEYEGIDLKWSRWWRGVTSMYAQEIAVNHILDKDTQFEQHSEDFDVSADTTTNVDDIYHIHCWHSTSEFSKTQFQAGKYKPSKYPKDSLDVQKVKDYCMRLALYRQ